MKERSIMSAAFGDSSCGLVVRGYKLIPNQVLSAKIADYPPEIVEVILSYHPEIVDSWLSKLHKKYLELNKSCEFDNNPMARFNMPPYRQFEKHFQLWQEGGMLTISTPAGKILRIRNEKKSLSAPSAEQKPAEPHFTCSQCSTTFSDGEEYALHRMREIEAGKKRKNLRSRASEENDDGGGDKDIPLNPIWWPTES